MAGVKEADFSNRINILFAEEKGEEVHDYVAKIMGRGKLDTKRLHFDNVLFGIVAEKIKASLPDTLERRLAEGVSQLSYPDGLSEKQKASLFPFVRAYRDATTGNTIAHLAVQTESAGVVKFLVAHSPGLFHAKNRQGDTPLHVAARRGTTRSNVAKQIVTTLNRKLVSRTGFLLRDNHMHTPLISAFRHGDTHVIDEYSRRYFETEGLLEDVTAPSGNTLMHYAAQNPHHAMYAMHKLVQVGFPLYIHPSAKKSPFHVLGGLYTRNRFGQTPMGIFTRKNAKRGSGETRIAGHEVYDLLVAEMTVHQRHLGAVTDQHRGELLREYELALETYDYARVYELLSHMDEHHPHLLTAVMGRSDAWNIFTRIAEDRSADPRLVNLFSGVRGSAYQLKNFEDLPMCVNARAVEAIFRIKYPARSIPLAVAFHGILSFSKMRELKNLGVTSLDEIIDRIEGEDVAISESVRAKVHAYKKSIEELYPLDKPLTGVYSSEESIALAQKHVVDAAQLLRYLSTNQSYTDYPKNSVVRIKANAFYHQRAVSEIAYAQFMNRLKEDEREKADFLQATSNENSDRITNAADLQELLKSPRIVDGYTKGGRIYKLAKHFESFNADPVGHMQDTVRSIEALSQDRRQQITEEIQKEQKRDYRSYQGLVTIFKKATLVANAVTLYRLLNDCPPLVDIAVNDEGDTAAHFVARSFWSAPVFFEFFALPGMLEALATAKNKRGESAMNAGVLARNYVFVRCYNAYTKTSMDLNFYQVSVTNRSLKDTPADIDYMNIFALKRNQIEAPATHNLVLEHNHYLMSISKLVEEQKSESSSSSSSSAAASSASSSSTSRSDGDDGEAIKNKALEDIENSDIRDYDQLVATYGRELVFSARTEEHGHNSAHLAVLSKSPSLLRYLASIDFPYFDAKNNDGQTPLDLARSIGDQKSVEILNTLLTPRSSPSSSSAASSSSQ